MKNILNAQIVVNIIFQKGNNMWHKIKEYQNIKLQTLAFLSIDKKLDNTMVSWKTKDGLLHLYPFPDITKTNDIDETSRFTLWTMEDL